VDILALELPVPGQAPVFEQFHQPVQSVRSAGGPVLHPV